ncbi:MAG: hypothetical protein KatS3mg026_0256 [Bacteroidia bacterium]|nr:MAG: hypothetical protein KatS3mg026_0256 [Bacteroidia bacterium]
MSANQIDMSALINMSASPKTPRPNHTAQRVLQRLSVPVSAEAPWLDAAI